MFSYNTYFLLTLLWCGRTLDLGKNKIVPILADHLDIKLQALYLPVPVLTIIMK